MDDSRLNTSRDLPAAELVRAVGPSRRIRVGIVGTSNYVRQVHVPCLQSHTQADLVAICGRDPERTALVADAHAIPHAFSSFDRMLTQAALDAVIIASPDDLHHQMTMAALDAGLHILCEKPLALNAADARQMLQRAEAARVTHMVYFRWRWLPHYEEFRRLLIGGWVGKPLQWDLRYLGTGGRRPGYAWRFDERRANGVLGDLGSHMIDLARWLGGEITHVAATVATFGSRPGYDGATPMNGNDAAMLLCRFRTGAQGKIQVNAAGSLGLESQEQAIRVYGDDGWLEVVMFPRSTGPTLRGARQGEPVRTFDLPPSPFERGETYEERLVSGWCARPVADRLFVDAILSGDIAVEPSFADGVRVQEIIDGALESNSLNAWIAVEPPSPVRA